MYRELLRAQWKSQALAVGVLAMLSFALPLLFTLTGAIASSTGAAEEADGILAAQAGGSGLFPILAVLTALMIVAGTWADDFAGKHVYALSLPVPRWYYLLLRMATGLTLLAVPAATLGIGAVIAAAQVTLPPGLHAYPGGLAVRFALASGVVFSILFAAGSASERTMRRLGIAATALFVGLMIFSAVGNNSLFETVFTRLAEWPSFMDAFTGRWVLFDV